jgi:DNA-binding NarL/FixJ family response regulator
LFRDESEVSGEAAERWPPWFRVYCEGRNFSSRQVTVLGLYLRGRSDKEIAVHLGCSCATVQEHWRRMAAKTGGRLKCDAIADFHRFLVANV